MADVASTITRTQRIPPGAIPFAISASTADAQNALVVKGAGGAGVSHYITHISIACDVDLEVSVGSGDDVDTALEVIILGLVPCNTGGGFYTWDFSDMPIVLAANKAILVDATAAGNIQILVKGATL